MSGSVENVQDGKIVDLAVPFPISGTFHYLASPEMVASLSIGNVVQVSFKFSSSFAFVLGFPESTPISADRLKWVENILFDEPLFDEPLLRFLQWISDYYCHPLGEVMATAFPKNCWQLTEKQKIKAAVLCRDKKFLERLGLVVEGEKKPRLTDEQQFAVSRILDVSEERPFLLQGVTGSGKTEVYMTVLEQMVAQGKGAIILVPEIALTPQLLSRFSSRFPGLVAVLHSDLTYLERYVQWQRIRSGLAKVVVGARSAVFAPISNLGLVVVDEEHETSYKQEDSLRYNARDVAILRAKFFSAKVILGSATPSLESYWNVQNGKFSHVILKNRVMMRPLPRTSFVDLKDRENLHLPEVSWFSRLLFLKMTEVLKSGQQVLLYLNRLGFAHFLYCSDCGHTWRCRNCDVALTYYSNPGRLKCHYCASQVVPPSLCPECQGVDLQGMGLGTEQVEKKLSEIFPLSRIVRMDRSVVKTRKQLEEVLGVISRRECDIVVGTQMVVKGHDFPGIALVGILLADASLNIPDFRAYERTFQIITQVSGRAGRGEVPGEVVIQTLDPDHPVLKAAAGNQTVDFYNSEIGLRKRFSFPPICRAALLRFQHSNVVKVEQFASEVTRRLQGLCGEKSLCCSILGPAESPISRIKNLYRWHCLIKGDSVRDLQIILSFAQNYVHHLKSPVQFSIDVDPISLL